jgi:hypothetical protein
VTLSWLFKAQKTAFLNAKDPKREFELRLRRGTTVALELSNIGSVFWATSSLSAGRRSLGVKRSAPRRAAPAAQRMRVWELRHWVACKRWACIASWLQCVRRGLASEPAGGRGARLQVAWSRRRSGPVLGELLCGAARPSASTPSDSWRTH